MTPKGRKESARFEPTSHPGIERFRTTGILWIRQTVYSDDLKPVKVDRSLKTKQLSIALDRAKRIRLKISQGDKVGGVSRTMSEIFDLVIEVQQANGERTLEQAAGQIENHLRPWFKANCPDLSRFVSDFEGVWARYRTTAGGRIPPDHLKTDEERDAWRAEHPEPRKLDHDRRYLVMALGRAHSRGWIKREFEKDDFPLNQVSEAVGQFIPDEDVRKLLEAAKPLPRTGEGPAVPRLYLQVLMAVTMGMRLREILNLPLEEVDTAKWEITLDAKRVKTRRPREVPIPVSADVRPLLAAAIGEARANGGLYVFPATYHNVEGRPTDWKKPQNDNSYHWDQIRDATGVDARFHDLRHTCITNMLAGGMPEISVRKICGVSERVIRQVYAHIESTMKERFRGFFAGRFTQQ